MGKPYFDNDTIHIGSRNFGNIVHSITFNDNDDTKKILIGYICIKFDNQTNILKIDNYKV
jgi:hypothetical protein